VSEYVPGYDPAQWPFAWCTWEEARGFVSRLRSAGSSEGKVIAQEFGVSWSSIKRAVRWYLISVGDYDPEGWSQYGRERKAEGRRRFLALVRERDRRVPVENRALALARDARAEQERVRELELELLQEAEVASTRHSVDDARARRRKLQRRLNARNRRYAGA
jgi:hypothetical protein